MESLLLKCPDLDNRLENVNDIDYYGFNKVLKEAVNLYYSSDVVHMLNCIGNDFFPGGDTHILQSAFAEMTGINCIRDNRYGIHNILTKKQITIIRHTTLDDY